MEASCPMSSQVRPGPHTEEPDCSEVKEYLLLLELSCNPRTFIVAHKHS